MTKTKMQVHWVPCQTVEAFLKTLRTSDDVPLLFEYQKVSVASIKRTASALQNARFNESLNEDHVHKIALAMEAGKPIPPTILTADKGIVAGNHRIAAAELIGDDEVWAYVLRNADRLIKEIISRTDNASHGLGLKREEYIQQAIYLHVEQGYPLNKCATLLNLKLDIVKEHLKSFLTRRKLEKQSVNTANLHHSTLLILSEFDEDPRTLVEMGRTAAARRFTAEQTRNLATLVKEESATERRLARIEEARQKMLGQPRSLNRKSIRDSMVKFFLSDSGQYQKIMTGNHGMPMRLDDIGFISDSEIKKVAKRLAELNDHIQSEMRRKGLKKIR